MATTPTGRGPRPRVDGTKAAGEWAWEHKGAIAVSLVVGAAVACVLATAGIRAGVGLVVAGGSALAVATPFIVGGTTAVAFGITDRATDDDPNTRAFDVSAIGVDLAIGVGTAGLLKGGSSAVISAGVKRAATTRAGQAVAQSTVGRATSTAVASTTQLGTTVKSKVVQATAATANQARSRAANSKIVLNAKNYIGRQSGRQTAARAPAPNTPGAGVLDDVASSGPPNRIYSARELIRRSDEPGPFHNFPGSFDDDIFSQGSRTYGRAELLQQAEAESVE